MKNLGEIGIQIDRWPVQFPRKTSEHLVSVIIVAHYPAQPQVNDLIKLLDSAKEKLLLTGQK